MAPMWVPFSVQARHIEVYEAYAYFSILAQSESSFSICHDLERVEASVAKRLQFYFEVFPTLYE